MADVFDVKSIWASVERVATGGAEFTEGERELVGWLQQNLGLQRSPEQYAKRTRQRYQRASRLGETAKQTNQREYRERQAKKRGEVPFKGGSRRSRKLNGLIDRRNQLLPETPVDRDEVDDYIAMFGEGNVIMMLEEQIDSCLEYQKGHSRPGNRRWHDRRHTISVRPDFNTYIVNTDILFFYHSHR